MPGSLNGRELAEKLSQEKPGLKIVYTSGYSLDLVGPGLATQKNLSSFQSPTIRTSWRRRFVIVWTGNVP